MKSKNLHAAVQTIQHITLGVLLSFAVLAHAQIDERPSSSGFSIDLGSVVRLLSNIQKNNEVSDEYEMGQLQVLWESPAQAAAGIQLIEQSHRVQPIEWTELSHLGVIIALYQLPSHASAVRIRDELQNAHPDWVVDLNAIQTLQGPRLFAFNQMRMPEVSGASSNALRKMHVGVIDAPFNDDVRLQTTSLIQHSVLPKEDQAASASHGNAVASLLAGAPLGNGFVGAAPNINLIWAVAVRQVNGREGTNSFLMSKALDWLLGQRAQIINISIGGTGDAVLATVFRKLESKPVAILAAAGNGGATARPAYPAAYPAVLAVTAVDASERIYSQANQGSYVALAASGVDLWTPTSAYVSGTSFSTALASAALARMGGASSRQFALQKLCRSAKDLGETGSDPVFGCGLVQFK